MQRISGNRLCWQPRACGIKAGCRSRRRSMYHIDALVRRAHRCSGRARAGGACDLRIASGAEACSQACQHCGPLFHPTRSRPRGFSHHGVAHHQRCAPDALGAQGDWLDPAAARAQPRAHLWPFARCGTALCRCAEAPPEGGHHPVRANKVLFVLAPALALIRPLPPGP